MTLATWYWLRAQWLESEMAETPGWAEGLTKCGTYYEGWVSDIDERLSSHARATVTCFGTRRSKTEKEVCFLLYSVIKKYYPVYSVRNNGLLIC